MFGRGNVGCWQNGRMPREAPWSDLKATLYSLLYRAPRTNTRISGIVPLKATDRVLDVGCGPGAAVRTAAAIASHATGVDASPKMIEIARRRSAGVENVTLEEASAEDLPFADASFTVVWTIQSWHHWNDSRAGLREAARVLTSGGHLYVIEKKTSGDHGLSPESAARLAAEMDASGFTGSIVTTVRKYLVVSGTVATND